MYTPEEKQLILSFARRAIEHYLTTGKNLKIFAEELPEERLKEVRSCFVTLTLNGQLRGCIGHIEPVQPLYLDIVENAVAAAFNDPRFTPLTTEEYANLEIEVSVLSDMEEVAFASPEELLEKILPFIDGVIIKKGNNSATYLPQVWDDMPDYEEFFDSLCLKAGLGAGEWKQPGLQVWRYQVEAIK